MAAWEVSGTSQATKQFIWTDPYTNIPEGYVVWLGPQHFLDNFFCAHFITFSVICWVENHYPYPKVLGQFLLPHKLYPHPLGCNKLGKSAKECGNTVWWPHSIYTRLSKSAEIWDGRVCYTPYVPHPFTHIHGHITMQYDISYKP